MGIRENMRAIFMSAPAEAVKAIGAPPLDVARYLKGYFDYIHLFVTTRADLQRDFKKLRDHLKPTGMAWISWPKSGQLSTDLNIKFVIEIGYDHGLVESKTISINDTWSALKFTHPKKDKEYNNSYGKLKI